jgi:hypothetical protein
MRTNAKECRSCWKLHLSEKRTGILNNRFGKKQSEETKKKIGLGNKGKGNYKKGYTPWNKGTIGLTHWKPERRQKIMQHFSENGGGMKGKNQSIESRRLISLHGMHGDKNINWKGGIAYLNTLEKRMNIEWRIWHSECFKRDNKTCRVCLSKDKRLELHHIHTWSEHKDKRYDVSNGITLCSACHKLCHYKEKYLIDFFEGILNSPLKNRLEELINLSNKIQALKNAAKRGKPKKDNPVLNHPGMDVNA